MKELLCLIGIHKWKDASNNYLVMVECERCKKKKVKRHKYVGE